MTTTACGNIRRIACSFRGIRHAKLSTFDIVGHDDKIGEMTRSIR
jgi:hypothetical protein